MLDEACQKFLEFRGLDVELADRCGISTAKVSGIKRNSVLTFAYLEHGNVINEKYRMLPKEKFWQQTGRKKIFWNADALDDPGLESGQLPLVICEGELDALSAIQCGFPLSVSVPDGAPPANMRDSEQDSGSDEQSGRYEFLWNARDKLKKIKRFVLAVDGDGPGQRLREELIRRLSAGRCSFVEYPQSCKDLNDVLMFHGPDEVVRIINSAKPCPVKGLYKLSDYPEQSDLQTYTSGWPLLDTHFRLWLGEFIVVTGIPQHGKSSWTLHLLSNLADIHGFRSAIFSPEMSVVPIIRNRLRTIKAKRPIEQAKSPEISAWIEDNFRFIGDDPSGSDIDTDLSLEWIIDVATEAVLRDGIRILLIDPWNEIEHWRPKGESLTEYIGRAIRMLKRFSKQRNVTVIVVAHPVKQPKNRDGGFDVPCLYDIADSAAWFNKADHGIVVYRKFDPAPETNLYVVKSRLDEAGETGMVRMKFDPYTHRFEPLATEVAK